VIWLVFKKYRKEGQIAISQRFPFYIAVTDIGLSISLLSNQMHSVLYRKTLTGGLCTIFSTLIAFTGLTNMTIVTSIAVLTYLRVCKAKDIDTGPYDWKLHATVWGNGLLWATVGIPSFGPSKYWCYQEMYAPNKSAGLVVIGVNFTLYAIAALCFLAVLKRLQKYRRKDQQLTKQQAHTTIQGSKIMSEQHTQSMRPDEGKSRSVLPNQAKSFGVTNSKYASAMSSVSVGFAGFEANQPTMKEQYNSVENRAVRKMLLHMVSFLFNGLAHCLIAWELCSTTTKIGLILSAQSE
jgi:hypothetical protein